MNESKLTFFKQSGWLVIATGICGVFLVAVYPFLSPKHFPPAELGVFAALLRLFTLLGLATIGLQVVMAQDAAAAVTEERRRDLAVAVRTVARGILLAWVVLVIACAVFSKQILAAFNIPRASALWVTLALLLTQMFLPFMQGLLQGAQNFAWLGWSIMANGFGRFVAMGIAIMLLHGNATAALGAAFFGLAAASGAAFWPSRDLFRGAPGNFEWMPWFRRVLPLTGGIAASQFLMLADVLFVQMVTPEKAPYYSAVAMVSVGLVTFTAPMASVMFPKLVRSAVQSERSNSLQLALAGTAILGIAGAVFCTLFPELPLRILYFGNTQYLKSAQLIPWFMWAMLPMTVANVLISNLLAKQEFRGVLWLVLIAIGYGISLSIYLRGGAGMEQFALFKGVILRLGIFSTLMLLTSALFTALERKPKIA